MKKFILTTIIIGFMSLMMSCENIDYDQLFQTVSQEIETSIPDVINSDFIAPSYTNVEVIYELNGQSFDGEYIYESPFYDIETKLNYKIIKK